MLQNSIARLRNRKDADDGFTLVELAVVVLIIAILLAIAIPTFLGARNSAQNRAAQSNVRNALTAANVIYSDRGNYPAVTQLVTDLGSSEPSLDFSASPSTAVDVIAVATLSGTSLDATNAAESQGVALASRADSGTCWRVLEVKTGSSAGVRYGTGSPTGNPSGCVAAGSSASLYNLDEW